jgi:hypothetical protein
VIEVGVIDWIVLAVYVRSWCRSCQTPPTLSEELAVLLTWMVESPTGAVAVTKDGSCHIGMPNIRCCHSYSRNSKRAYSSPYSRRTSNS